jgi:hypothetical protein
VTVDLVAIVTKISSSWETDLNAFVDTNCSVFADIDDTYSHKQHKQHKYCRLVEGKLNEALGLVSASIEDLEEMLMLQMK